MIGRLVRWAFGAFVLTSVVAGIGALIAKGRYPSRGTADSDEVELTAIMEPLVFESAATSFRGGSLLCWFGGGDLDLRAATLDPSGAHLTTRVLFGGGRIIAPDDWNVESRLTAIFGGVGDARPLRDRSPDAPTLVLEGFVIFGGFGIVSSKAELDA